MASNILGQGRPSALSMNSKPISSMLNSQSDGVGRVTRILPVMTINPPNVDVETDLSAWFHAVPQPEPSSSYLLEAANALQNVSIPVAIPTETVYGLAADATRSSAVRGIYIAKQRPSDNPLIVHVGSLPQLRNLLQPTLSRQQNGIHPFSETPKLAQSESHDPIPLIYHPLISRFWPGPLTILLPNPPQSRLAPEVTSTLSTFGVRMPSSPLARLLISLADRPLAAPSANASTRPSPTTAQHVYHDLKGRIDIIVDGGPCQVGVESTVVDGLSDPPAILRPGGIGIEEIRALGGRWSDVTIGYRDRKEYENGEGPRAPGMKYRHYAPRGRVLLFEAGTDEQQATRKLIEESMVPLSAEKHNTYLVRGKREEGTASSNQPTEAVQRKIGIITTRKWHPFLQLPTLQQPPLLATTEEHENVLHGEVRELPVFTSSLKLGDTGAGNTLSLKPRSNRIVDASISINRNFYTTPKDDPNSHPHLDDPHPYTLKEVQETRETPIQTGSDSKATSETELVTIELHSIQLGARTQDVARGLFSALRLLDDELHCDIIAIEGIPDDHDRDHTSDNEEGENLAAAVMNRLRKAASG